ncbi:DUF1826 domain-containing protein [Francisella philomiragia]|uniref:DUF1826 domain-containing protein n=1 Tax=Francisella philomiragia TaxID=28110 RepID=UPI003519B972
MVKSIGKNRSQSKDKLVLSDIYDDNINISIWQRNISENLAIAAKNYIRESSSTHTLPIIVKPLDVKEQLTKQLPNFPLRNYLIEDITEIIDMFCYLFDLEQAGLRLAIIDKAMCPRFHVDHVPCRLITTYSGTGSEWLYNEEVDRNLLGKVDNPFLNKNTNIQKLNTGDIALLKGESWIGNSGSGIVHRSPNIVDGERRLLLTLDFA